MMQVLIVCFILGCHDEYDNMTGELLVYNGNKKTNLALWLMTQNESPTCHWRFLVVYYRSNGMSKYPWLEQREI